MSVRFIPVRGTEAKIKNMPYEDGALYFATDTKKIYLDSGRQRHSMGGSGASLYYINQATVPHNEETEYYILGREYLVDENATPKVDDLLINSDGSFYKVVEVDNDDFISIRIAISGSGGGGGGPISTRDVNITWDTRTI